MTWVLNVLPSAQNDMTIAVSYYDLISTTLGDRFLQSLDQALDLLAENPYLFQIRYEETRIVFLRTFPFGIHYSIDQESVSILAVLHTRDNPEKWIEIV